MGRSAAAWPAGWTGHDTPEGAGAASTSPGGQDEQAGAYALSAGGAGTSGGASAIGQLAAYG